jgi:CheY-like chemotaxis protein
VKKHILIVDDDEAILDALSLVLEDAGFLVEAVSKGQEALKKVASHKPDLILLDMLLSGNDGRQLCKHLKANPVTKEIPIIMISAHPSAQHGATEAGADDFLAKPFETKHFLKKVEEYL